MAEPIHLVHTLFTHYTQAQSGHKTIRVAPPLCGPMPEPMVTTARELANCAGCYEKDDRQDEWERKEHLI